MDKNFLDNNYYVGPDKAREIPSSMETACEQDLSQVRKS